MTKWTEVNAGNTGPTGLSVSLFFLLFTSIVIHYFVLFSVEVKIHYITLTQFDFCNTDKRACEIN